MTPRRTPAPPATSTTSSPAPSAASQVDDVEDMLGIANDNQHSVLFYRANDGRQDYLEARNPSELRTLGVRESARRRYGGGSFTAKLRARSGTWVVSRTFTVEGDPKSPPWDLAPAAIAAAAATSAPAAGKFELPEWVEKIILPIGVALAAGITNKLLAEPKTDPLVLELLKLNAKGNTSAGVDPLELQRTIMAAEERGESRGRELGELLAGGRGDGEGPLSAIREAAPLINRFLDRADAERRLPPANDVTPPASLPSSTAAPTSAPDIMPTWLRPFITYRGRLLKLADDEKDATLYADVILDMAPDATLVAALQAHDAGVLEQDLLKAIPELAQTPARQKFTRELVAAIGEGLERMRVEEGESTSEGVGNG